jgi:hypothetical protein
VHDYHKGEVAIRGHCGEDVLNGLVTTRGGANAYDETWSLRWGSYFAIGGDEGVIFCLRSTSRHISKSRIWAIRSNQLLGISHFEISVITKGENCK